RAVEQVGEGVVAAVPAERQRPADARPLEAPLDRVEGDARLAADDAAELLEPAAAEPRELVAVHRHALLRRAAELAEDLGRVEDRPVVAARAARVIDAARLARHGALREEGLPLEGPPSVRRREEATELLRDAEVAQQRLERLVVTGARALCALVEGQADD